MQNFFGGFAAFLRAAQYNQRGLALGGSLGSVSYTHLPAAWACTTWARPISSPSRVTKLFSACLLYTSGDGQLIKAFVGGVADAIYHATHKRFYELPITREQIAMAVEK